MPFFYSNLNEKLQLLVRLAFRFPIAALQGTAYLTRYVVKERGTFHGKGTAVEGPAFHMRQDKPGAGPCHAHVE